MNSCLTDRKKKRVGRKKKVEENDLEKEMRRRRMIIKIFETLTLTISLSSQFLLFSFFFFLYCSLILVKRKEKKVSLPHEILNGIIITITIKRKKSARKNCEKVERERENREEKKDEQRMKWDLLESAKIRGIKMMMMKLKHTIHTGIMKSQQVVVEKKLRRR